MPRDAKKVRGLLQQAALDLYGDRGFEGTTTAEIAARAGVTERTFFRHFADKREVLFDGETELGQTLTKAMKDVPDELGPWDALFAAFRAVGPLFIRNRPFSEPRRQVIASNPALQERELAKVGAITFVLAAALRARGVAERTALLASQMGMATLTHAVLAWLDEAEGDFDAHLVQAFRAASALSETASHR